ncbi:hypothetical protein D3C72_710190 [compost metagenome]
MHIAFIFPETFVLCIIGISICFTGPGVFTFNPEMIMGVEAQLAFTTGRLMYTLCQGNRCRDAGSLLFFNSNRVIFCNIIQYIFILSLGLNGAASE